MANKRKPSRLVPRLVWYPRPMYEAVVRRVGRYRVQRWVRAAIREKLEREGIRL